MKKIFAVLLEAVPALVLSQVPHGISHQSMVWDNQGSVIKEQNIKVKISILQNSQSGSPAYIEIHQPRTNENGVFTIVIGEGNATTGTFTEINWGTGTYYLRTEIDPYGGNSYTITGSSQILSVPYALYALNVKNVDDADASPTNELQNLGQVLSRGNSAGNNKISSLANPVSAQDAATKAYVDQKIREISGDKEVSFVPSAITRLCPTWIGGDKEFDGHGPDVQASASLKISTTKKSLYVDLYLHEKETQSDWTECRGNLSRTVYTTPTGWSIKEIITDTYSSASYRDTDHDIDYPTVTGGKLVKQFAIMGDTGGNDVGNCTTDDAYMNVYFNSVTIVLHED